MEIKQWLFYSFSAIISVSFFKVGFEAFDETGLSGSVPFAVMFLFKHSFAIFVLQSYDYRFAHCALRKVPCIHSYSSMFLKFLMLVFLNSYDIKFVCIYYGIRDLVLALYEELSLWETVDVILGYSIRLSVCFSVYSGLFVPVLVVDISSMISEIRVSIMRNASTNTSPSSGKWVQVTRFAIGMVGTVLFQSFFVLKSFKQVLAFLYLEVALLGSLVLSRPCGDLGIFNFILGNVIVGSTVNQFGLEGKTWIVYSASVFLYALFLWRTVA